PDLETVSLAVEVIRQSLCQEVEGAVTDTVNQVLKQTGAQGRRRKRVQEAYVRELLAAKQIGGCWLIRSDGAANIASGRRDGRLLHLLLVLLSAHTTQYVLWILSWWLLGWMTLKGRFETGWLLAWLFLLVTLIPFRLLATFAAGQLAIRADTLLKRRLLIGV